jgi:hypothetical protein
MSSITVPCSFATSVATLVFALAVLHPRETSFPFQDPSLPVDERVDDLVARTDSSGQRLACTGSPS